MYCELSSIVRFTVHRVSFYHLWVVVFLLLVTSCVRIVWASANFELLLLVSFCSCVTLFFWGGGGCFTLKVGAFVTIYVNRESFCRMRFCRQLAFVVWGFLDTQASRTQKKTNKERHWTRERKKERKGHIDTGTNTQRLEPHRAWEGT